MCRFCCSLQHMCCWWRARVCESVRMWESELQRRVRKRERGGERAALSTRGAASDGCATSCSRRSCWEEDRGGEVKPWKGSGKGLGWEDVKQSWGERASEEEEEEVSAWGAQVKESSGKRLSERWDQGKEEYRSEVTPAIVALVIGGKSRLFSSFVTDPVTFSPFLRSLES